MQSTLEKDDKQAGLNDLVAILDADPARIMLEPPDLHVDPVDRAMSLASTLPPPDPALRAAPPPLKDAAAPASRPRKASFGRSVVRGLLAIAVGAAATLGWLSYGEAAKQMFAAWAPQLVAAATAPAPDVKVAGQEAAPAAGAAQQAESPPAATVTAATPPPPPVTPAAPPQAAPVQAAAAPDLTPKLEEMTREIASLRETIEQLKSSQQQLSRDLAKAIEQQEPRRKSAAATPPKPTTRNPPPPPQPAYTPPPPQRQVYTPPRDRDPVYTSRRDEVYVDPPRVYTPPPPQVYVPQPYEPGAPRPPRALP
jgi:hypothetical protein